LLRSDRLAVFRQKEVLHERDDSVFERRRQFQPFSQVRFDRERELRQRTRNNLKIMLKSIF
jgi:hypothetical protein